MKSSGSRIITDKRNGQPSRTDEHGLKTVQEAEGDKGHLSCLFHPQTVFEHLV